MRISSIELNLYCGIKTYPWLSTSHILLSDYKIIDDIDMDVCGYWIIREIFDGPDFQVGRQKHCLGIHSKNCV